jgi:hypothetical protein
VPRGTHATADASDPAAFDLYVGGKLQGLLTEPLTPLDMTPVAAAPAPTPAASGAVATQASKVPAPASPAA